MCFCKATFQPSNIRIKTVLQNIYLLRIEFPVKVVVNPRQA